MIWTLEPSFLDRGPLDVVVVGVGGTGGEVVSNLLNVHLWLKATEHPGLQVTAWDPDDVSESNVVRQRYSYSDIGRNKATTLVSRVNLAYNLEWNAVPARFTGQAARCSHDIVISCVDTRAARASLHKTAFSNRLSYWKYWLDLGNDRATGQAILGTPRGKSQPRKRTLPCATELHPTLMGDTSIPDDDTPSCSALEAVERQGLFVNKLVALLGVDLLWQTPARSTDPRARALLRLSNPHVSTRGVPDLSAAPKRKAA